MLAAVQRVPDGERIAEGRARDDDGGQVAVDTDRVERREERAVRPEQVADVVRRRRDDGGDPLSLEQRVQTPVVEGRKQRHRHPPECLTSQTRIFT